MRRRPATRPPAAATVAAWIVLLAGLLVSAAGLAPAWADPAPSPANASTITTTEPASSSSTTTSEPVGSTTTSPKPTNASSTTVTTQLASSTTTTTTPAAMLTASSPAPGTLSINAPGLAYLGADARNARTLSAHLGTVRVTDTRRVVDGAWTASVSATTFSNGHQSPNQQLPRSSIAYWSGPVLHRTGTATLVPGQAGPAQAVLLTRTRTAFSATAVTGDNTATWNPTIIIRIPPAAVAGHYHGTILHSVA